MPLLVVHTSKAKWSAFLVLALAFIALGLWLALSGNSVLVGWLNVAFFGSCATMFVRQLIDRRPRIVVDDAGVTDNTLRVGCIEWGDIRGTELRYVQGNAFLSLDLRDPAKYVSRLSPTMQRLTKTNKALGFTELSVNLAGIKANPEEVAKSISDEVTRRSFNGAR